MGKGVKEEGGEEEDGQSVLPTMAWMIHLILVEGRPWGDKRKVMSQEFLTVYDEANALQHFSVDKMSSSGFPGGAVVKNLPANAGDAGSSPDPG